MWKKKKKKLQKDPEQKCTGFPTPETPNTSNLLAFVCWLLNLRLISVINWYTAGFSSCWEPPCQQQIKLNNYSFVLAPPPCPLWCTGSALIVYKGKVRVFWRGPFKSKPKRAVSAATYCCSVIQSKDITRAIKSLLKTLLLLDVLIVQQTHPFCWALPLFDLFGSQHTPLTVSHEIKVTVWFNICNIVSILLKFHLSLHNINWGHKSYLLPH